MKKIILTILVTILMIPTNIWAAGAGDEYVSLNLEETLAAEEIEKEYSSYKETEDQITIYLFRGQGCSFCRSFIKYLNSITDEYGKYFKLVSYEVWQDSKNNALMDEVADFLGEPAGGVPYIVIGDEVFAGYISDFNEDIEKAIMDLYESEERYDVFEEMAKASKEGNGISSTTVIIWNAVIVAVGAASVIGYTYYSNKKVIEKLNVLEKKIKTSKKEEK